STEHHEAGHSLLPDPDARLGQLGGDSGRPVGAPALGEDIDDPVGQFGVGELPRRLRAVGPLVVGGPGDLEQMARLDDVALWLSLLRLDERVHAHRVSLAKKAVARFRMSRSFRSWTNSSCSSVVIPGRRPASMSAWATQRRTALTVRPRSRDTSEIVLPLVRHRSITSALYSSENDRRTRV